MRPPCGSLQVRDRIYRVFVLPGSLQVDLSFTPASHFRPAGPKFALLFGEAGPSDAPPPPTPGHFFGLGVVQALHARRCIERARHWQAEQAQNSEGFSGRHLSKLGSASRLVDLDRHPGAGRL